jgi:hypothetical protein
MLTESDLRAAALLAKMPDAERKNAERLGFVALGLKYAPPSVLADTVDITPEILAEEARIRATLNRHFS